MSKWRLATNILLMLSATTLCACVGPILNQKTIDMGPSVGPMAEKQVLGNLGRFIDDPWAIPGHVEITGGQIQVNQNLNMAWKLPYTNIPVTREFDVANAQQQETDYWNLTPVTDAQDLRRLRALYHYAVCGNKETLKDEWRISMGIAPRPQAGPNISLAEVRLRAAEVRENATAAINVLNKPEIKGMLSIEKMGQVATHIQNIEAVAGKLSAPISKKNARENLRNLGQFSSQLMGALRGERQLASAEVNKLLKSTATLLAAGGGGGGGSAPQKPTTFDPDQLMYVLKDLPDDRWLYWSGPTGDVTSPCSSELPSTPAASLGTYNGHELWTTNTKAFSDFVLAVAAAAPNTSGYEPSAQKGTTPPPQSKVGRTSIQMMMPPGRLSH